MNGQVATAATSSLPLIITDKYHKN